MEMVEEEEEGGGDQGKYRYFPRDTVGLLSLAQIVLGCLAMLLEVVTIVLAVQREGASTLGELRGPELGTCGIFLKIF